MKKSLIVTVASLFSLSVWAAGNVLPIMTLGSPILRQTAVELTQAEIASPETQQLIDDMIETMKDSGGVGLAAPQVDRSLRLFVMKSWPGVPLTVVINPRVEYIESAGKKDSTEGCLSIPGRTLTVPRFKKLHMTYLNRRGELITEEVSGFKAIISQHEYDHLNGVLIIDLVEQLLGELDWSKYLAAPKM